MAARSRGLKTVLILAVVVLAGFAAYYSYQYISRRNESASRKAGREAREAYEKGKDLFKTGIDKTEEATKKGYEAGKDAAQEFQKGWKEGGK
jgi:hypothetical protein